MNKGIPKNFENPILTKTGQERYILWQNSEVLAQAGIDGTISFGVDITERRQSEREVIRISEKLSTLTHQLPCEVFETDVNGSCTFANDFWFSMTGLTLEQARDGGGLKRFIPKTGIHFFQSGLKRPNPSASFISNTVFNTWMDVFFMFLALPMH
ncbi:PAS domain-containing protein [Bdellovibrionota bacterium FG-2]